MLTIQKNLSPAFFALLSLPATAIGFGLSVQIAALSWLLNTQYHLDIHEIGLVWAAGPLAGIIGQVFIGILSDKVWFWGGRRRPFILIGGVLAALCLLALPNLDIISTAFPTVGILAIALVVALLLDLSINVSFNPTRSLIADVTKTVAQRTTGYTWMQSVSGSFAVLAFVIGAVWNNYVLIYFAIAFILILSIFPTFFIEEPKQLSDIKTQKINTSFSHILLSLRPLWGFIIYAIFAIGFKLLGIEFDHYGLEIVCLLITLVLIIKTFQPPLDETFSSSALFFQKILSAHAFSWLGVQSMMIYLFAYIQYIEPTASNELLGRYVATSFLIYNIVAAVLPILILRPLSQRYSPILVHAVTLVIMAAACFITYAFVNNIFGLFILIAFIGIGWASIISLPFAIMTEQIPQKNMGLFMGLFNLSVVLPQLAASFGVGNFLTDTENQAILFAFTAFCLLLSAFIWGLLHHQTQAILVK